MTDLFPDRFMFRYEVTDRGYLFYLQWKDNNLFLKQFSDNTIVIQELITPTPDEWNDFWYRMDEIRIWDWYQLYEVKCMDSCVEGDQWELNIEFDEEQIESHGSDSYPSTFREFVKAIEELTGILIEFIHEY